MKKSLLFSFSCFTLLSLNGMDLVKKDTYPPRRIVSRSVIIPINKVSYFENRLSNSCPDMISLEKDLRSSNPIMWYQKQYSFHYEIAKKYLDAMVLPIYFTIESAKLYKQFGRETKKAGCYYRTLINQYKIQMPLFDVLLDRVKLIDKHFLLLKYSQVKKKYKRAIIADDVDNLIILMQEAASVKYKLVQRHKVIVKELPIYSNPFNTRSAQLTCFKKFSKTD